MRNYFLKINAEKNFARVSPLGKTKMEEVKQFKLNHFPSE